MVCITNLKFIRKFKHFFVDNRFSEFGWLLQWQPTNTALSEHADSDVKPGPLPRAQV